MTEPKPLPEPITVKEEGPLTIRHWFLHMTMTSVLVCVILLGMVILFLPDGVFNVGPSPVISADQEYIDTKNLHKRLNALEQQLQKVAAEKSAPAPVTDLVASNAKSIEEKLEETSQAAQEYEARLRQMQEQAAQETHVSRIIFGVMQLKNAYMNEASLQNGIAMLKDNIKDQNIQEQLAQLDSMIKDQFPSKQEILTQIEALKQSGTDNTHRAAAPNTTTPTQQNDTETNEKTTSGQWIGALKSRAGALMDEFVTIRPTSDVQQAGLLDKIGNAVQSANYSLAAQLAQHLPESPKTKILRMKLNTRAKAQNIIHNVVTGATNLVSNPNSRGALY